jgi:predicted nucleic acid-binding protein
LKSVIDEAGMQVYPLEDERRLWAEVFAWLDRYREHEADWTDGCLAVLCGRDKRLKVWTYDGEFATIWRRPDGTKIPLAVKGRG